MTASKPWATVAWSPERELIMYRDWGVFFMQKQCLTQATYYFDKALEIKADDYQNLLYRSKNKRGVANTKEALKDSLAAQAFCKKEHVNVNLEVCDALYELNQFENCFIELHNQKEKFTGKKVDGFLDRITVINENFKDTIGPALGFFIMEHRKHFEALLSDFDQKSLIEDRPLWKILREQGKCDVLSIMEKEEYLYSPREIAKRKLAFKVFNQIYFNRSWLDTIFLEGLNSSHDLLLTQRVEPSPILKDLVRRNYASLKKFLKMLNARIPTYKFLHKDPEQNKGNSLHENNLNRIQYQTRRNMHTILRNIKRMRSNGEIENLSKYIESVMGEYVILKTNRVMPWKMEFIYEVYNTFALAFTDRLTIPETFPKNKNRILVLFRMSTERKDRTVKFKFGDKSTFQDPEAVDHVVVAYKQLVARLEKRMKFAKYSIEKCYILHEIARSHMTSFHFDECCLVARRACEEAKHSKCYIWHFLSLILICKSHAVLEKVERLKEVLEEAQLLTDKLRSVELRKFVDLCSRINDSAINIKKHSSSNESVRKVKKNHMSVMNSNSLSKSAQSSASMLTTLASEEKE